MSWAGVLRNGAQSSAVMPAVMEKGAVKRASRNTPPVRRTERSTSESGSVTLRPPVGFGRSVKRSGRTIIPSSIPSDYVIRSNPSRSARGRSQRCAGPPARSGIIPYPRRIAMAALENDSMGSGAAYPTESKLVLNARAEGLNVEIVGPISLFPDGQKCGIHFGADATVTVMLGMRDYGHGYASPYFASLVAARLGIAFKRIRLYYGGVHPAVKIAPWRTPNVPSRSSVGIANAEIGDLIESLCDQAIEQGRRCLASS